MYYQIKVYAILVFGFSLRPIRTKYLLVHLKDELQVTHNGHTSRGKPTVDELLSREFQCDIDDDCEEKFPSTPICDNGVCIERATTPEPDEGPNKVPLDNPNRRCNSNKDCLYGYSCKDKVHNMGVSGTTIISKCVIESRGIFRESGAIPIENRKLNPKPAMNHEFEDKKVLECCKQKNVPEACMRLCGIGFSGATNRLTGCYRMASRIDRCKRLRSDYRTFPTC